MKNFLVHVVQGGGCDYTIGCGHKVYPLAAETKEEAQNKVLKRWFGFVTPYDPEAQEGEEGYEEEEGTCKDIRDSIAKVTLYEISSECFVDLEKVRADYDAAEKAYLDRKSKKDKMALYEELKKELGK